MSRAAAYEGTGTGHGIPFHIPSSLTVCFISFSVYWHLLLLLRLHGGNHAIISFIIKFTIHFIFHSFKRLALVKVKPLILTLDPWGWNLIAHIWGRYSLWSKHLWSGAWSHVAQTWLPLFAPVHMWMQTGL